MRILELTETLHPGGAETFVVRLSNALAAAGHDVTVAVAVPIVHPALREALGPQVDVEVLPVPFWRLLAKAESACRKLGLGMRPFHAVQRRWLERLVRNFRPDAIHSHLLKADLLANDARRVRPGMRHVVTTHGDYRTYVAGSVDPHLTDADGHMRQVATNADSIAGVADDHFGLFRAGLGADAARLHLIYNGYEAPSGDGPSRTELGLPEGVFLFGMVSRGIEDKGWRQAVESFLALAREDCALVLVGEGPCIDALRLEVRDPRVEFAGFAGRPIDFIRHFDCGLLPTFYEAESLPTVIVEYLAFGKPVIATDIGEIRAMLTAPDGSMAGILVPQKAVGPLAKAMADVMDKQGMRTQLAESARAAFAQFAMATCVERYEALFGKPQR